MPRWRAVKSARLTELDLPLAMREQIHPGVRHNDTIMDATQLLKYCPLDNHLNFDHQDRPPTRSYLRSTLEECIGCDKFGLRLWLPRCVRVCGECSYDMLKSVYGFDSVSDAEAEYSKQGRDDYDIRFFRARRDTTKVWVDLNGLYHNAPHPRIELQSVNIKLPHMDEHLLVLKWGYTCLGCMDEVGPCGNDDVETTFKEHFGKCDLAQSNWDLFCFYNRKRQRAWLNKLQFLNRPTDIMESYISL
ncbi:hypothetical protein K440DRAFT_641570 [Wilcoxina mikolae CBS 423.85]|nr:hypothetical protein K440DRAFT_641570 [Wilcoxina mikolae CBS 423.85]